MLRRRVILTGAAAAAVPRAVWGERPPLVDGQPDPATLPAVSLPLLDICAALQEWGRDLLTRPEPHAVLAFPALSSAFFVFGEQQYGLAQSFALYLNAQWSEHERYGDWAVRDIDVLAGMTRDLLERAEALTPGWMPASLDLTALDRRAESDAEGIRYDRLTLDKGAIQRWEHDWLVMQSLFFLLLRFSEQAQALADDLTAASR